MELVSKLDRRSFLRHAAAGLAVGALGSMQACRLAASQFDGHALAPVRSHYPAKAKQLVIVFLSGGFSHIDTFDPKPRLTKDHGKPASSLGKPDLPNLPLMGSPFAFAQHGESGIWVSDLFPHLARVIDDLCVIRSLSTDSGEHNQSVLAMHTGSSTVPMPSIGSWISYGLGTLNPNLPPYMILVENLPFGGSQSLDNNFLPPIHQGMRIAPGPAPISNLQRPVSNSTLAELESEMLRDANAVHAADRRNDQNLLAAIESMNIARGMMRVAPEVFDLSRESESTLSMYGMTSRQDKSIASQCLLVRRLIERGVRVVELIDSGSQDNWDSHNSIMEHRLVADRIDRALAALIVDLKQRGLLEETLVAICTEFGRTPWIESTSGDGRNHYRHAFTCLLAGAGVRGGFVFGQTDEHGLAPISDPCHVHDYHATILHLMGIDHTQLTYRYAGRDFRLTDVHGKVLAPVLA